MTAQQITNNQQGNTMNSDISTIDIEWIDVLPARKGGAAGGRRTEFVNLLRTRPGVWAKYGKNGSGFSKAQLAEMKLEQAQRSGFVYMRSVA